MVVLAQGTVLLERPFVVTVPSDGTSRQVLLAGLKAGAWRIVNAGTAARDMVVEAGKNTVHFESRGGRYEVSPVALH